jgi:tRNA nucleotidyltransferase (CCA-adding enzyme)
MKNYLNKLPKDMQDLVHVIGSIASLRGMPVYLVGGFVRDLILGVKNLDLDITVEGDGILCAEDLASRLRARLIRHRRFGTATVIPGHHLKIDIATARKEVYPEPATLPVVEFGTLKDDLKRRDFTINAMAINLVEPGFGGLVDFYQGKKDLLDKKIRVLHELSFVDDPTRILRAIRFEKRYDFKIEAGTLRYLKKAVKDTMLEKVEPQRLRDELILLLKENFPVKHIKRLRELAGLNFIHRGLSLSGENEALLVRVANEIHWFHIDHFPRRKLDIWLIYFMALIDRLDMKHTKLVCGKFAFPKGEQKRILSYKKINGKFISRLSRQDITPAEIFALLEPLSYEVILLIKAKYKNPGLKMHIEDFLEIYTDMRICISGHHLHGLGLAPGPEYKKIFSRVLKAKLNGLVNTEAEEIALIKKSTRNFIPPKAGFSTSL